MLRNGLIASVVMVLVIVVGGGCQEAKEKSRNTMAFVKGDADVIVECTPAQVMEASRAVAGEMGLIVIAQATTQEDAKAVKTLVTRTTEDKKVTVRAMAESDKVTRVTVNTGMFGDAAFRTQVIDKIKARLGVPATTQPAN